MLLATYNIQRGRGLDLARDLDRTVLLLASTGADVIGLQEVVEEPLGRRGDQPRLIAEALGMQYTFQPARPLDRGHYGVALLARAPITSPRAVNLAVSGREPRVAVEAVVDGWKVFVCHFGLRSAERSEQVSRLRAELRRSHRPRVVMGDFNEPHHGPVARTLEAELGPSPQVSSHPALAPLFSLDRIYADAPLGGVRALRSGRARFASDHLPVMAAMDRARVYFPPSRSVASSRFAYQR